jgi:hypothetical protein
MKACSRDWCVFRNAGEWQRPSKEDDEHVQQRPKDTHRQGCDFTIHNLLSLLVLVMCCTSVPVIRSSAIGCVHRWYGAVWWRVALAICAADTAAAETRSVDAVDRAADEVNREGLKVQKTHTYTGYGTTRNVSLFAVWTGRGAVAMSSGWAVGIIEGSKYGMNNHHSRPT